MSGAGTPRPRGTPRAAMVATLAALVLLAWPFAGQRAWAAAGAGDPDTAQMVARVQPCTVCHGARGRATNDGYYPRIAGKPAGYLFDQMRNFRTGRRHFPEMVYLMQLQEESYLQQMAEYFAAQQVPYPPPETPTLDAAQLAQGRTLATQGAPAQQVPACSACHGTRLLGVKPAVPGLLGVSQDYLLAQLGAWRSGARAAASPDCMATIARRLTRAQAAAVTAWLAAQPVPADSAPEGALTAAAPLDCGSFRQAVSSPAPLQAMLPAPVPPTAGQAARGRQLVIAGDCAACHTAAGEPLFAGGRAIPTAFGTFYSPNITPDAATGLGRWSSEDFWRALHEGISRDGRYLYPTFPYPNYTRVTRADADAMYAYLRTVPPVRAVSRAPQLRFPYDYRVLLAAWRALYFRPGVYRVDPTRDAAWNRGAYLVQGLGHCSACHQARNSLGAVVSGSNPAGGLVLDWYAPSLMRPQEAGLQDWTLEDIATLLGGGALQTPHHSAVTLGPMSEVVASSLQWLDGADLRAMARYLQSLPRAEANTASPERAPDEILYEGQRIYARDCAGCHGQQGEGRAPRGPPLAGDRAVLMQEVVDPIRVVLFGGYAPGTRTDPRPYGMPPFGPSLDDDEIAAVLTYVRGAWGNAAPAVVPWAVGPERSTPLW